MEMVVLLLVSDRALGEHLQLVVCRRTRETTTSPLHHIFSQRRAQVVDTVRYTYHASQGL